jgi:uncharacterized protein (TIGR00297 family)
MFFLYFLIFILIGLFLNITRGYDLFTVAIIYMVFSFFLYFIDLYAVIFVILFFAIAEGITLFLNKKHGKRNYKNVLGNCLASIVFFIIGIVFNYLNLISSAAFAVAALAAISAAFSDTLSSEIGRLSKKNPVLITTLKPVKTGVDGGITFLGISAALLGTIITGVFFYFVNYEHKLVFIIAICGIIGSLVDSVIGATIERKGYFNNNLTNFTSTFLTGVIAILMFLFI